MPDKYSSDDNAINDDLKPGIVSPEITSISKKRTLSILAPVAIGTCLVLIIILVGYVKYYPNKTADA